MKGVFVPEAAIGQLRVFSEELGCSPNEAVGILVTLWMFGVENADEYGIIQEPENRLLSAIAANLSETLLPVTVLELLIQQGFLARSELGLVILDWQKWQEPLSELKRFEDRLAEKRRLDMLRKRKSRAAQASATRSSILQEIQKEPASQATSQPEKQPEPVPLPEPPPPPPKKDPKPKPEKKRYADFVHMTEAQYNKLISDYGQTCTAELIRRLDNYKGSRGKSYKDDYRAILSWVVDDLRQRRPDLFTKAKPADVAWHSDNPF